MADATAARFPALSPARPARVVRRRPGFGGVIGAMLLFCVSMTPSLLPRHWALQGTVTAVTMLIGYGAGATVGALARTIWPRVPPASAAAWRALAGASAVLAVVFLRLGEIWQRDVRRLVGVDNTSTWDPLLIVIVAAGGFGLLLLASRAVRLGTRKLGSVLARSNPRPVAAVAAVGLVASLSYGVGQGVPYTGFVEAAERMAASASRVTASDVARPQSTSVSGGPGSLVAWDTLGAPGREFVSGAVPATELSEFSAGGPRQPSRVYVGIDSAPGPHRRAELAVRELERTGGFDRSVLAVIVTTGTGWVNPDVADSLEYLYGGDSALVAMQYSYLPSWISFLADRSSAGEAASALIEAVRARLEAMPVDQRPTLVVYGESLGAYGVEQAAGTLEELAATTDGVLLAGPPHTSPIWRNVTEGRDASSPMWRPTYHRADTVLFAHSAADLHPSQGARPGMVYLQHASDPVVWWSPELLYRKPAWLAEPTGPDVSGAMRWYPVVTFWQVTADLVGSTMAPSGHGHSYGESAVDAWATLVPPPGWTEADTARLRSQLS